MNAKQQKFEALFDQALNFQADQRAAFLTGACGGDTELLGRLEALLEADAAAGSFLPSYPTWGGAGTAPTEMPGARIGRYTLLEKIGEGGCGEVYGAEQEEPVHRRVALKVIRPGMDTVSVIARFEAERQALALMDHPNIAKVLDGGVTASGRPFFVMELVRGVRVTDYCLEQGLSTRARLDLFSDICSAVQHAHQKGIIHRDLKPSNILVTQLDGRPVPKVIDFGIAKATEQKLTDRTLFTHFAQFLGTPAYMSPEQAAMTGADIDTRSDIYSLGVLLYELLTGTTPFDARELLQAGFDEMRRTICETEPAKPSSRLTQYQPRNASARTSNEKTGSPQASPVPLPNPPRRGTSHIASDLDWIVMKALEKDRARRYETASSMAADIQRHLNNEPVTARPAGAAYRFRKFVQRNKILFIASSAVLTAVLIGLGVSSLMFIKERQSRERAVAAEKEQAEERRKAESEASKSRQVAKFLTNMLRAVGPSVALGDDTKLLRKILDHTVAGIDEELNDQPSVEADLRFTIGNVYLAIGDYTKAGEMHAEVLAIQRELLGDDHPDVAVAMNNLALDLQNQGKLDEAERLYREALALQRNDLALEPSILATTLHNLASLLFNQGKLDEAEGLHRESLEMYRVSRDSGDPAIATALDSLALVLQSRRKLDQAESMLREALAMRREAFGDEHPAVASSLNNLANVLMDQGKLDEAAATLVEALSMKRKLLGPEHPEIANVMVNLANTLRRQRKPDEAEPIYREALAMHRKFLGNDHHDVSTSLNGLALALHFQGRSAEAEPLLREAEATSRSLLGDEHPEVALLLDNLGCILRGQEKYEEAEPLHREALEMARSLLGPGHFQTTHALGNLASALDGQGKTDEANTLFRDDITLARSSAAEDPDELQRRLISFADRLYSQRAYAEAEPLLLEILEGQDSTHSATHRYQRESLTRLVRLFQAWEKPDQASEWRQKLAEFDEAAAKPDADPSTSPQK